jgi:hypothetical protein
MLRPDVFMVPAMGFLARLDQRATDSLGKVVACQKNLLVVGPKISIRRRYRKHPNPATIFY